MLALATLATLALIVLAGAVGAVAYRALRLPAGPATRQPSGSPEDDVDPVIAGPPQVPVGAGQSDSVRDWLCHYTHGRKTWGDAVAEFYRRAAADPQIASYFHDVDLPALQRHFTATIVIVTSKGLTAKTVVRMAEKHRGIRDRDGRPITSEVYDRVVTMLKGVLRDMGVPNDAIADLGGVVRPLRAAIVAA
jgi:hemoglobin